jgi:hypothetical protein
MPSTLLLAKFFIIFIIPKQYHSKMSDPVMEYMHGSCTSHKEASDILFWNYKYKKEFACLNAECIIACIILHHIYNSKTISFQNE